MFLAVNKFKHILWILMLIIENSSQKALFAGYIWQHWGEAKPRNYWLFCWTYRFYHIIVLQQYILFNLKFNLKTHKKQTKTQLKPSVLIFLYNLFITKYINTIRAVHFLLLSYNENYFHFHFNLQYKQNIRFFYYYYFLAFINSNILYKT